MTGSLQKLAQLGRSLELWDGIQFLERRSERVGEAPDRAWPEFLVLRFEVEVVDRSSQMFRSLQLALHERFVDNDLGGDIGEFAHLPRLHLLAHRLKVPLHAIDTHRNAIDQRERLRVFREHGSEHACDNVSEFWMR